MYSLTVSAAAFLLVLTPARAQTKTHELSKISGREYVRLCSLGENAYSCLVAVYGSSTVNKLLDVIDNQKTFCPPLQNEFPPADIVARVSDWLRTQPNFLDKPSSEGLSAALKAMYPCR